MGYPQDKFNKSMIQTEAGLSQATLEWARSFGEFLATNSGQGKDRVKQLTTSQLRRFFGQIKRLQVRGYTIKERSELLMLGPLLAYATGRDKKKDPTKIGAFYDEISIAIGAVIAPNNDEALEQEYFKNFVNLVEAVVAYHRFYGGGDLPR
jgi:CRISPR-associated protein Csm2